jgi:hypothetical protein
MSRKKLTRRTRRIGIALLFAALAIPATAQAHPAGNTGPGGGPNHGSAPQIYVPTDPGHARLNQQASPAFVPSDPGLARVLEAGTNDTRAASQTVSTADSSGFSWDDALIGAGVTAALMLLAVGGALVARRQGRLGYR